MKREILFRGKRIDSGEWIEGFVVQIPTGQTRIYCKPFKEATANTWHYIKPESVGQFTGLLDKNGNRIFEGDVLYMDYPYKNDDDCDNVTSYRRMKVQIHFTNGCFWWNGTGFTDCNWHFYDQDERVIIGNIHDNPELANH